MFSATVSLNKWKLDQLDRYDRIIEQVNAQVTIEQDDRLLDHYYQMRTALLMESINDPELGDALYRWIVQSRTKHTEEEFRDLIAFGVPHSEAVGKKMLIFAMHQTRDSHSRFKDTDLTELDEEDATAFALVLSLLINVYVQRRTVDMMRWEDSDLRNRIAMGIRANRHENFPLPNPALVDLIMKYADRHEDIATYLIERENRFHNPDIEGLIEYLENGSRALSGGVL